MRNTHMFHAKEIIVCLLVLLCQLGETTSQAQNQSGVSTDEHLKQFLRTYIGASTAEAETIRYSAASVDLRDDGKCETIVYLTGTSWCGTGGCTMLILIPEGTTFKVLKRIPAVRIPISVLKAKSKGWHDISVVKGRTLYEAVLSFDGKTYLNNGDRRSSGDTSGKAVITDSTQDVSLYPGNKGQ